MDLLQREHPWISAGTGVGWRPLRGLHTHTAVARNPCVSWAFLFHTPLLFQLKFRPYGRNLSSAGNHTLEPNITSIGKPVAKLWPFLYIQSLTVVMEKLLTIFNEDIWGAYVQQLMHSLKKCIVVGLLDSGDTNERLKCGQCEASWV